MTAPVTWLQATEFRVSLESWLPIARENKDFITVEEQDAAVGQRYFAGTGQIAAAYQSGMRDGVVRGAEWACADQGYIRRKRVGDRVDAGDIERFVDRQARQDGRHGASQEGLA